MKNLLILILFISISTKVCHAGYGEQIETILGLKETTLLVVVDDQQSEAGKALMKAFNKFWKFTPFKFIQSKDMDTCKESEKYSFFVFAQDMGKEAKSNSTAPLGLHFTRDYFLVRGTADVYGDFSYGMFRASSSVAMMTNKVRTMTYMPNDLPQRYDEDYGYYSFGIYLGGTKKGVIGTQRLENEVQVCELPVFIVTSINPNENKKLKEIESMTAPYIAEYVARFEKYAEVLYNNKKVPKRVDAKSDKVPVIIKNSKSNTCCVYFSYDGGFEKLKTMKLLLDTAIADTLSKIYLMKLLGFKNEQVLLAGKDLIEKAIYTGDPSTAVMTNQFHTMDYNFFSTDGTLLGGITDGTEVFDKTQPHPSPILKYMPRNAYVFP